MRSDVALAWTAAGLFGLLLVASLTGAGRGPFGIAWFGGMAWPYLLLVATAAAIMGAAYLRHRRLAHAPARGIPLRE